MLSNTRESFPPETPTTTNSSFLIILYLEMVFAAFLKMEFEKHSEQRLSGIY